MAKLYPHITEELAAFIRAQPIFFVASAPLAAEGHVNLSPKGLDCLRILAETQVAYLDLTGSGNETSGHLAENGRLTLMWCAFSGPPRILRLYGRGRVVLPGQAEWAALAAHFPALLGQRQIIVADITRVQSSCGYAVPLMDLVGERDQLLRWAAAKGEAGLADYQREKNGVTLDGLCTPLGAQAEAAPADSPEG
jgi:hypothetical protein